MSPNVHQYWVYMLTNRWKNVLYTGKRIWQHKHGAIPGFTKKYNCDVLVYFEEYGRVEQAIAREKEIKGWVRVKKNALVATTNPEWNDLAGLVLRHAAEMSARAAPESGGPSPRFAGSA